MVKLSLRLILILASPLLILNVAAKNLSDYQIGDKAEEDIVATTKLSFVDADETQAMKERDSQRVPPVILYDTNAADELDVRFRDIFSKTQVSFLKAVDDAFGHPTLSAEELGSRKFESVVASFQKENPLFPLSANRAALWASGDADQAYESSLAATLRQAMTPVIRPDPLPAGIKLSNYTLRLVPVGSLDAKLTSEMAQRLGKGFPRTNMVTIVQVKKDLQSVFDLDERDVGKYLATLLKPNCVVDVEVTEEMRAKRVESEWAVVNYQSGEVIAHRGQVIDKKIKAALDQLKDKADKAVVGKLEELQVKQQAAVGQLQQLVADDKAKTAEGQEHIRWLIGALSGVVVIMALAIWQLARRKQSVSLLPVPATAGAIEQWQQRALIAEQNNEKLQSAARAGLFAYLSQWLSQAFTRRLVSDRRLLLDTQGKAMAEMAEFEARLEKVHAPLQERLVAYERRIAELEKELAARGEENRELLKAKIEMMRKQLESQREKSRAATDRMNLN
jgi:membrane-associated HD superfamily phosphohydrolase